MFFGQIHIFSYKKHFFKIRKQLERLVISLAESKGNKDTVLLKELYPKIEKSLKDPANVKKLERIIAKFVDRNSTALSAAGPMKQIMFVDKDADEYYELVGTSATEIKAMMSKSRDIYSDKETAKYPFNSFMPMVVRFFAVNNNDKMAKLCTMMLMLSMYPLLYRKYFKYDPNENIMNYTIANLSGKYTIKQAGTLLAAITETATPAYELYKKDLIEGYDITVVYFAIALRTRLNSFLKNITNEFRKNHDEGRYLNTEYEVNDGENFREANASIYEVGKIVDKTVMKLIVDGPSSKLISAAAKNNQVSVNELRNYISGMIVNEKQEEIKQVVESILYIFVIDGGHNVTEINTDKFLLYCLDVYKRSNTTDKNVIAIKKILDIWLDEAGLYKKTQRLATLNNFRRALYVYFVMSIQYANIR